MIPKIAPPKTSEGQWSPRYILDTAIRSAVKNNVHFSLGKNLQMKVAAAKLLNAWLEGKEKVPVHPIGVIASGKTKHGLNR